MRHNIPELPCSALVTIGHAIDLTLLQIVLERDRQSLPWNGRNRQKKNLFPCSPFLFPLVIAKGDSIDISKVQHRWS